MRTLVKRSSSLAVGLTVVLVAGCSDRITEPAQRLVPDDATQTGRGVSQTVFALEPLPGSSSPFSIAYEINDLGQVVGQSSSTAGNRAVIWDNTNVPQDLGTLPGHVSSLAASISNDGQIIAGISSDGAQNYAVRWLRSNGQWLIDPLPGGVACYVGHTSSDGTAIAGTCSNFAVVWLNGNRITFGQGFANGANSRGQVVGTNSTFDHAIMWTISSAGVTTTDLGTLGGTYAVAQNINDAGDVTGWSENASQVSHAFRWSPRKGAMVDLTPDIGTSGGYGINATGKVVGDMFPTSQHAGYYDGRKVVDLGVLPGYNSSIAFSVNNNGQAVGSSYTISFTTRATRWVLK